MAGENADLNGKLNSAADTATSTLPNIGRSRTVDLEVSIPHIQGMSVRSPPISNSRPAASMIMNLNIRAGSRENISSLDYYWVTSSAISLGLTFTNLLTSPLLIPTMTKAKFRVTSGLMAHSNQRFTAIKNMNSIKRSCQKLIKAWPRNWGRTGG